MEETFKAYWTVHTPNLLNEIGCNTGASALKIPLNIFGKILYEVARRASELNDPELNQLMMRLTLYAIADPESPDYDRDIVNQVLYPERKSNG